MAAAPPRPWHTRPAPGTHLSGMVACVAFAALYLLLGHVQFYHWLVTDGLLFAALWLLPRGWWPWLFTATVLARVANGVIVYELTGIDGPVLGYWQDWPQFVLGNMLEPFLVAIGVVALHRWGVHPGATPDARDFARLHLAAVVSAVAVAGKDVLYVLNDGSIADVTRGVIHDPVAIGGPDSWELLLRFAIKNFMGCFVGIMLLAPPAFWLASSPEPVHSRRAIHDAQRMTLPAAILFVLLGLLVHRLQLAELLRMLLLVVVAVAALRNGWRGAILAVLGVSLAVAVDDHLGLGTTDPIQLQLFIAIAGAMGLMFGAAVDDNRRQTLALREAGLAGEQLRRDLASAAAGNLRTEERERHRIAGDLHDEFGQSLTAMQTHLHLMQREFHDAGKGAVYDQLMEMTRAMRLSIREVLERLRPASLDELGLYGAIDRSAIRRLAENSGLAFDVQLRGDARLLGLLDDAHRVAAYRLVQESTTNIVRHARATRCEVRLRVEQRRQAIWLFVDVRDDGIGTTLMRPGNGLANMRDRVTALGGRLHLRDLGPGLRVHAVLRQDVAS